MLKLKINGQTHEVDVSPEMPLLWVLRDVLGFVGTKFGCGLGQCGACTVLLNGKPTKSCVMAVSQVVDQDITTIEGIGETPNGKKLQDAWVDLDVPQCGYCQAGQIMAASGLLSEKPNPTDADIDTAMSGNLCRCATYNRIREAIKQAAIGK